MRRFYSLQFGNKSLNASLGVAGAEITLDTSKPSGLNYPFVVVVEEDGVGSEAMLVTAAGAGGEPDYAVTREIEGETKLSFTTAATVRHALTPFDLRGASGYPLPDVPSEIWITSQPFDRTATQTLANDQVRYVPIYFSTPVTITHLAIEISASGTADGTATIGLYSVTKDGGPGDLIDSGTLNEDETGAASDLSTTGIKRAALAAAQVVCGWYYVGVVATGYGTPSASEAADGHSLLGLFVENNGAFKPFEGFQEAGSSLPATAAAVGSLTVRQGATSVPRAYAKLQ